MISHKPWRGDRYDEGVGGQKLLLVGFSHWNDDDHDDFTIEQVREWARGDEPKPFGTSLRGYFEKDDPDDFWNSISFINILPNSVGLKTIVMPTVRPNNVERLGRGS